MTTNTEYIPRDFVCLGKREGTNGKPLIAICPINDDGTLGERQLYEWSKKRDYSLGCVYTGTKFAPGGVMDLDSAKYVKPWPNEQDRILWRAERDDAETSMRIAKLEKDADKINDLQDQLLPARKMYDNFRMKHDYAGMEALERAVIRALRASPRTTEK